MKHKARSYSDTAPVTTETKRRGGDKLADPGALVSGPLITEQQRETARRKLRDWGDHDLLEVLGLVEPRRRGPTAVDCPTCDSPAGVPCVQLAAGTPLGRPHKARIRLAEAEENERQATEEFLSRGLAEAGSAS